MRQLWKIKIIESEPGWGQKHVDTRYFSDEILAKNFVEKYNSKNTDPYLKDKIYLKADYPEIIYVPSEDEIDMEYYINIPETVLKTDSKKV